MCQPIPTAVNTYDQSVAPQSLDVPVENLNMTKSDNAEAFSIHYNMMHISGTWPVKDPSLNYILRTILSWSLGIGLCITMFVELVNDIHDFAKLSEILYIVVTISIYLVKLLSFTYYRKPFVEMVKLLKEPIFVSYPEDMDYHMVKAIKLAKLVANFYRFLCVCCMILYTIYPMLDNKPLPFPFPYDLGKFRILMYVFQIAGVCSCAWNNSCLDTLTTSLMSVAASQIDILIEKITRIPGYEVEGNNLPKNNIVVKQVKNCIEHHYAIIKYIEYIDGIFAIGFLGQFIASVMVICNTLFQVLLIPLRSWQFFLLMNYFTIMVCELLLNCWFGNEIMWKSVLVGEACYKSKWYNHNKEINQYLFIIMERSKRPLVVRAFKFSKLYLAAFVSIIQWSYSYLALLMKLYSKHSALDPKKEHI